jgi:hypothetical protein
MNLDKEIFVKLFVGNKSRLTRSDGSIEAKSINNVNCLPLTFVPKMPWKNISDDDEKKLFSTENDDFNNISLIKLPNNLKELFIELKIHEIKNQSSIFEIQNSHLYKRVLKKTISYFNKHNLHSSEITPHSLYFGDPNLSNNTYNREDNVYIGMHLDSFERALLKDRKSARNRVCINLGIESRYLLFYNISLLSMYNYVSNDKDVRNNVNMIYKKFALKFPDFPIYRLEVKPLEAYIAPTEYVIHDGSNWNSNNPDINLVFRGKFKYKKKTILSFLNFFFNFDN